MQSISTSDLLSLCSFIVAILAFIIALLTFVYTVFTGPHIKILPGGYIWLFYSFNKKLVMQVDLAFFNTGAQPGALVEFSGTLILPDGTQKRLHTTGFAEGKTSPDSVLSAFKQQTRNVLPS